MISIGSILSILNESIVLVRLDKQVRLDTVLMVFVKITVEQLQQHGLSHLYIPKGEIRITAHQKDNFYLAERFKHERTVVRPYSGLLGSLFKEEVTPGPWSAEFDMAASLNLPVDKRVKVGDLVGELL